MNKESQGRHFQNTALFSHARLQEHQMANLCLHAICPQGDGTWSGTLTPGPGTRSLLAVRVPGLTTVFFQMDHCSTRSEAGGQV